MSELKLGTIVIFDIASTAALLLLSLTVAFVRSSPATKDRALDEVTPILVAHVQPRRALIFSLLTLTALAYLADGAVNVLHAVLVGRWTKPGPIGLVSYVLGLLSFSLLAIFLSWKDIHGVIAWGRKRVRVFAALAILVHVAHVTLVVVTGGLKPGEPPIGIPEKPLPPKVLYSPLLHFALSLLRLLILIPLYPALAYPYKTFAPPSTFAAQQAAEEGGDLNPSTSLTNPADVAYQASSGLLAPKPQYGTFTPTNGHQPSQATSRSGTPPAAADGVEPKKPRASAKPEVSLDPTWREMGARLRRLLPYLWPRGSLRLEGLALFCFLLLIAGRFITFLAPTTLRELVATFDRVKQVPAPSPWKLLFLFVLLRFLQGSGGLSALRDIAWAPVMQYSDRNMSQLAFDHLLNLSLAFHTRRKTGEVLRILDRGQAINRIFELILFSVIPAIVDIIVALVVFTLWFNWTLSAVIFLVMFTYIVSSVALTSWRTKIRRQMNEKDIITRGIHTDCLLNYETVKYFGGEQHEAERYRDAIRGYQVLEFKVMAMLNLLNLVQNFIISFGLLIGSILVAVQVVDGTKETSDFIFFITYLAQVYGPLTNLGYIYRSINQSLVDTEKLFRLLDEPKDIIDKPGAPDLIVTNGEIEFRNVSFTYDDRTTALKDVSFKVPTGSSVALVGESGSGKSTILRLLYRFYDLKEDEGAILIDGQDIRDITQASLRRAIGVVPQDSVLFNHSIAYNIRYGKFGASQEELEYAAQAAQMHERIVTFPDGYHTRVGERGVRLSGGEKQRVSIARTFLKNAPILLLDEATSALDTTTEKDIQKALQNLLTGRSSLSIAHRLSTIANSDIILVLKDGEIIESGSHRSLLAAEGVFAAMWAEQISTENQSLRLNIPSDLPKAPSGYEVSLTAGPHAPLDITETPVGREAILPTEPPAPALTASAPPSATAERKVGDEEETQATAGGLDVAVQEPATQSDNVVPESDAVATEAEPVLAETVPEPKPADDGPSYASVAATEPASESAVVAFPSSAEPPVAFPSAAPVAFPSDDRSLTQEPGTVTPAPGDRGADTASVRSAGVTFSPAAATTSRPQTPEAGEKRKRTASQNLQRFARRMSLGGRRSSMQAAEAARAVEVARSESPKPIESLMSKLTGRGSSSKDDSGSVKSGSIKVGSAKGDEDITSGGEEEPTSSKGGTLKKSKSRKKSKK